MERQGRKKEVQIMADEVKETLETTEGTNQEQLDTGGAAGNDGGQEPEPLSFDAWLESNKDYQAEFDRRVSKATSTAVNNARERWETITDEKVSEAEKLAKMTKDERDRYNMQKRVKGLEAREKAIMKKELQATAKNALAEKELPLELAELLDYTDAEACNKSIDALDLAFRNAVADAVNERLKGAEPMKKAPEKKVDELEDLRAQADKILQNRW